MKLVTASTMDELAGLTPAEEEALIESLTAIHSGNYISSEDMLRQLRLRRGDPRAVGYEPRP
jgi:hypothetical protein